MRKQILQKKTHKITQYEKIKVENFKENILQNLRDNVKEIFDSEFTIFGSKCEELVQAVWYSTQIESKAKDKIIDELLKSFSIA